MPQEPKHDSVPQPFESGNIVKWVHCFNICAKVSRWNDGTKLVKLPTLLESKTLPIWLDLTEEQQGDNSVTVRELMKKPSPFGFSSIEAFHTSNVQNLKQTYNTECHICDWL